MQSPLKLPDYSSKHYLRHALIFGVALDMGGLPTNQANDMTIPEFLYRSLVPKIVKAVEAKLLSDVRRKAQPVNRCWERLGRNERIFVSFSRDVMAIMDLVKKLSSSRSSDMRRRHLLASLIFTSHQFLLRKDLDELDAAWNASICNEAVSPGGLTDGRDDSDSDDDDVLAATSAKISDTLKCPILRFASKFGRYYRAGGWITKGVVQLWKGRQDVNITVKAVEGCRPESVTPTSIGIQINGGWGHLESLGVRELGQESRRRLNASWVLCARSESRRMYIHAEIKLALFYMANPHLAPLYSMVGLTKKSCLACYLYLKYVHCFLSSPLIQR